MLCRGTVLPAGTKHECHQVSCHHVASNHVLLQEMDLGGTGRNRDQHISGVFPQSRFDHQQRLCGLFRGDDADGT